MMVACSLTVNALFYVKGKLVGIKIMKGKHTHPHTHTHTHTHTYTYTHTSQNFR